MSKLRVNAFTLSIDGYGAGPDQDLKEPLGVGGEALHNWMFGTGPSATCLATIAGPQTRTTGSWRAASKMLGRG